MDCSAPPGPIGPIWVRHRGAPAPVPSGENAPGNRWAGGASTARRAPAPGGLPEMDPGARLFSHPRPPSIGAGDPDVATPATLLRSERASGASTSSARTNCHSGCLTTPSFCARGLTWFLRAERAKTKLVGQRIFARGFQTVSSRERVRGDDPFDSGRVPSCVTLGVPSFRGGRC